MSGAQASVAPPLAATDRVVIIGAGLAGVRIAITLREEGFTGAIVLISEEAGWPYDRPPLSKAILTGALQEADIALAGEDTFSAQSIDYRAGLRCTAIEPAQYLVRFADGVTLGYDRLVLATGSRVRQHPLLPRGMAGVHYLRDIQDARALRAAAGSAQRIVVIGAGVIGLEVAASLAEARSVVVVDPAARVMARATSPAVGAHLAGRHAAAGVEFRLSAAVAAVAADATGLVLTLDDGARLSGDLVVVGIGVVPNADLAAAAGLAVSAAGIHVDANGATSDPAIYAVGEVACYPGADGVPERQETWAHAALHAEHVARALVGDSVYDAVPSYWSDQYDLSLSVVGAAAGTHEVVRGDPASGSFLVFHFDDGVVIGVSAINAARELRKARRLIGHRVPGSASLAHGPLDIPTA